MCPAQGLCLLVTLSLWEAPSPHVPYTSLHIRQLVRPDLLPPAWSERVSKFLSVCRTHHCIALPSSFSRTSLSPGQGTASFPHSLSTWESMTLSVHLPLHFTYRPAAIVLTPSFQG